MEAACRRESFAPGLGTVPAGLSLFGPGLRPNWRHNPENPNRGDRDVMV